MRKILAFIFVTALSGCAVATSMYGPDGKQMTAIECNGSIQSPAACYKKASELCGAHGYDVLGRNGETIPSGSAYVNPGLAVAQSGSIVYRTLYVRCKE